MNSKLQDRLRERWWAVWAATHPDVEGPAQVCARIAEGDSEVMMLCALHPQQFMCANCYDAHAQDLHPKATQCEACQTRPGAPLAKALPVLRLPIGTATDGGFLGYQIRLPVIVTALAWICDEQSCKEEAGDLLAKQY